MKHRQTKIIWQRLIAALLISGVMPFLGVARNQGGQKVPAGFNYPQSQETVQVDAAIKSRSLSGVVTDPGGSVASRVLVERVRPGWGKRISAIFSDSQGRFAFAGVGSGTHFLRISKPGFNTMLLKVRVRAKAKSTLRIDLKLSNWPKALTRIRTLIKLSFSTRQTASVLFLKFAYKIGRRWQESRRPW